MNGKRQKKNKTLTGPARALAAVGVILSLLSIQQVWAEALCACNHQDPSSSSSGHCNKHAAAHQQCEAAHSLATHKLDAQPEQSEEAESAVTHQHSAQHQHGQGSHGAANRKHSEPSCGHHHSNDTQPPSGRDTSRDNEPSKTSPTAKLEAATSTSQSDGGATPATLSCCHIMPAANLPAASLTIYSADLSIDSTHVVFDSAPVRTFIPAFVFHPPPSRPIYVTVSSFLI